MNAIQRKIRSESDGQQEGDPAIIADSEFAYMRSETSRSRVLYSGRQKVTYTTHAFGPVGATALFWGWALEEGYCLVTVPGKGAGILLGHGVWRRRTGTG
eukprot:CAMPEP_0174371116 /NCGR_PEP_ID=MMETSP0811_2-20130205/98622_1 /TAXON_ID=73025 ORGANISM="Eutreptiella gymnastica-like, Strain CCMP1594" /NCGR_SAMPLE_ID=MMETSP0811_2 /ASSEMBLY_ACC=CAM_ASM_000667 /LENGTH=99 /DNA_ID=CAMNT_0015517205 /DNA_START=75 /DNA_END=371 /DNA_ORIENTATION=-